MVNAFWDFLKMYKLIQVNSSDYIWKLVGALGFGIILFSIFIEEKKVWKGICQTMYGNYLRTEKDDWVES